MTKYSTHLPVLEFIFAQRKIESVLEFGMGIYSTPFFIKHCNTVVSIEMQESEWYNKCKKLYGTNKNWLPILSIGALSSFEKINGVVFDLCFVDGHKDSRPECINMKFANTIVAHDTEDKLYGWDRVSLPGYKVFEYREHKPFTKIYSTDLELMELINKSLGSGI